MFAGSREGPRLHKGDESRCAKRAKENEGERGKRVGEKNRKMEYKKDTHKEEGNTNLQRRV